MDKNFLPICKLVLKLFKGYSLSPVWIHMCIIPLNLYTWTVFVSSMYQHIRIRIRQCLFPVWIDWCLFYVSSVYILFEYGRFCHRCVATCCHRYVFLMWIWTVCHQCESACCDMLLGSMVRSIKPCIGCDMLSVPGQCLSPVCIHMWG